MGFFFSCECNMEQLDGTSWAQIDWLVQGIRSIRLPDKRSTIHQHMEEQRSVITREHLTMCLWPFLRFTDPPTSHQIYPHASLLLHYCCFDLVILCRFFGHHRLQQWSMPNLEQRIKECALHLYILKRVKIQGLIVTRCLLNYSSFQLATRVYDIWKTVCVRY